MRADAVTYLGTRGPPNSPPMALLLRTNKMRMAIAASEQKSVTENAKLEKKNFVKRISGDSKMNLLSRLDTEFTAIHAMVDGCHCPC